MNAFQSATVDPAAIRQELELGIRWNPITGVHALSHQI